MYMCVHVYCLYTACSRCMYTHILCIYVDREHTSITRNIYFCLYIHTYTYICIYIYRNTDTYTDMFLFTCFRCIYIYVHM